MTAIEPIPMVMLVTTWRSRCYDDPLISFYVIRILGFVLIGQGLMVAQQALPPVGD